MPRWTASSRLIVAGMVVAFLALAPSAYGYQTRPEVNAQFDAVVEHAYRGSPQPAGSTCGPVCQDLWGAEQRATPGSSTSPTQALQRETTAIRPKIGISPLLRGLGTIGLGIDTFRFGWRMGTGINAKFLRLGLPQIDPVPSWSDPQLRFVAGSRSPDASNGMPAATDKWWFEARPSNLGFWFDSFVHYAPPGPAHCSNSTPQPGPSFNRITANPGTSNCYAGTMYNGYRESFYKDELDFPVEGPIVDYTGQPYDRQSPAPADPGVPVVRDRLRGQLESDQYPLLNQMYEFELGVPDVCDPVEAFVCNPPGPKASREDERRCELGAKGTGQDPDPARSNVRNDPALYVEHQPFARRALGAGPADPLVPTSLKKGRIADHSIKEWGGWGWRHIDAKHGWRADDISATAAALEMSPTEQTNGRLRYVGPEYRQNGAVCFAG